MADIQWPVGLRPALRATKSRLQPVGFRESPVAAGPAFIEPYSDDVPDLWSVSFIFKPGEARTFEAWLTVNRMRTKAPWFDFPLRISDPNVDTQECRFTSDGYPQLTSLINGVASYSAQLLVRQTVSPDLDDPLLVIWAGENSPDYNIDAGLDLLDIAINIDWPES